MYTVEYYLTIKRKELVHTNYNMSENIMLSERTLSQKTTIHII